jgi:hypothetical protein
MKLVILLLIFQVFSALAQARMPYGLIRVDVDDLRPTQMNVGMFEVDRKAAKIGAFSREERHEYLRENFIPVVVGPKGNLYILDHHHQARAVLESGYRRVYIKIVADLSHMPKQEFWKEMTSRGYVYLKDTEGNDIDSDQLPKKIEKLGDDLYRSIAGAVRRRGGFVKDMTPFAEFKWADFFRKHIFFDGKVTNPWIKPWSL